MLFCSHCSVECIERVNSTMFPQNDLCSGHGKSTLRLRQQIFIKETMLHCSSLVSPIVDHIWLSWWKIWCRDTLMFKHLVYCFIRYTNTEGNIGSSKYRNTSNKRLLLFFAVMEQGAGTSDLRSVAMVLIRKRKRHDRVQPDVTDRQNVLNSGGSSVTKFIGQCASERICGSYSLLPAPLMARRKGTTTSKVQWIRSEAQHLFTICTLGQVRH